MDERSLQNQIEEVLRLHNVHFEREVRLSPKDRIDFLCGSVGIEVKIGGGTNAVQRQLWRYASNDRITDLILATTRSIHRMPESILEKPIFVVHLLHSIF
jgi:hypothetical protein